MYLDRRSTAAVLAGLRVLQANIVNLPEIDANIHDILTDGGNVEALNGADIDLLCDQINTHAGKEQIIAAFVSGGVISGFQTNGGIDFVMMVVDYDLSEEEYDKALHTRDYHAIRLYQGREDKNGYEVTNPAAVELYELTPDETSETLEGILAGALFFQDDGANLIENDAAEAAE
jgi:hypothetical protein